jgi:hypothetical protein
MDDRKHPRSLSPRDGRTDAGVAPADSVREDSSVIYFGNALSEGFAIALRAMRVGADIQPADPAPPNASLIRRITK